MLQHNQCTRPVKPLKGKNFLASGLVLLFAALIFNSCNYNNPDNPYAQLSNNNIAWQDITDTVNGGAEMGGSLRRFYFMRSGQFQISCEPSDVTCVTAGNNSGSWQYITTTEVQVNITNGAILFYTIKMIDPNNLWLEDDNTRGERILRKFIPAQ